MENEKPSRTSEAAAVHRAVHLLLDDEPKILVDPIALRLVESALGAWRDAQGR
jgi:O-methyltransferase involved in polyketide biosynthesis